MHTESVWLVGGKSFTHSEETNRFTEAVRTLVDRGRLKVLKAKHGISLK